MLSPVRRLRSDTRAQQVAPAGVLAPGRHGRVAAGDRPPEHRLGTAARAGTARAASSSSGALGRLVGVEQQHAPLALAAATKSRAATARSTAGRRRGGGDALGAPGGLLEGSQERTVLADEPAGSVDEEDGERRRRAPSANSASSAGTADEPPATEPSRRRLPSMGRACSAPALEDGIPEEGMRLVAGRDRVVPRTGSGGCSGSSDAAAMRNASRWRRASAVWQTPVVPAPRPRRGTWGRTPERADLGDEVIERRSSSGTERLVADLEDDPRTCRCRRRQSSRPRRLPWRSGIRKTVVWSWP